MTNNTNSILEKSKIRQQALSTWDNEGGTVPAPMPQPYRTTLIFNEITLPKGLRRKHRLASGVWSVIRVLEGRVSYRVFEPMSVTTLNPGHPGRVMPNQLHMLEVIGSVRLKVDFYREFPCINA